MNGAIAVVRRSAPIDWALLLPGHCFCCQGIARELSCLDAIDQQPTKTPFILRCGSLPSKQNTTESICRNIQNTAEENIYFLQCRYSNIFKNVYCRHFSPLRQQIFRCFEMQMQIMERSLKLEKLSKPAANIWENTQEKAGNKRYLNFQIFHI